MCDVLVGVAWTRGGTRPGRLCGRRGRAVMLSCRLSARPGPARGLGFGAEECLDEGRQVSGFGDQVEVAAVVDGHGRHRGTVSDCDEVPTRSLLLPPRGSD